jgi:hypothetical protein
MDPDRLKKISYAEAMRRLVREWERATHEEYPERAFDFLAGVPKLGGIAISEPVPGDILEHLGAIPTDGAELFRHPELLQAITASILEKNGMRGEVKEPRVPFTFGPSKPTLLLPRR